MTTHLFDTLDEVADLLDQLGRDWALVGGLAVSAYVEPRFTRDIDIVLSVQDDLEAEEIVRRWRTAGFEITSVIEQDDTSRLATIRSQRPGGRGSQISVRKRCNSPVGTERSEGRAGSA